MRYAWRAATAPTEPGPQDVLANSALLCRQTSVSSLPTDEVEQTTESAGGPSYHFSTVARRPMFMLDPTGSRRRVDDDRMEGHTCRL
jgi:hypothetical protein